MKRKIAYMIIFSLVGVFILSKQEVLAFQSTSVKVTFEHKEILENHEIVQSPQWKVLIPSKPNFEKNQKNIGEFVQLQNINGSIINNPTVKIGIKKDSYNRSFIFEKIIDIYANLFNNKTNKNTEVLTYQVENVNI